MTWMIWALLSAVSTAAERAANRFSLANKEQYFDYMLAYNLGALVCVTLVTATSTQGFDLPADPMTILWLMTSGLLWFFGCVYSFKADQHSEVSVTALISQLKILFMFVAGIWIFGESMSGLKFVGLLLILGGLALRLQVKGAFNKGTVFKTLAVVITSGATLVDKSLSTKVSPGILAIAGYLLPFIFSIFVGRKFLHSFWDYLLSLQFRPLLIGVLSGVAHYALIRSFVGGPLSAVIPIYYLHIVFTFLLGVLFLNEKKDLARKSVAAALVTLGAVAVKLAGK